MLQKFWNYLFYAGVEKEYYVLVKDKIETTNRITTTVFSSVAFVLVSGMFVMSFFEPGFAKSQPLYLLGMLCSVILFVMSRASKKHSVWSYIAIYTAATFFLHYGILIGTVTRPEEQTVTFMVLLLFIPLIFVDKPIRMNLCVWYHIFVFIYEANRTKSGSVLSVDITDAVIFGLLGLVSGTVFAHTKVRGYVLERKLHIMSETDQLTGLNNRNCYELKIEKYPSLCQESLGCIYMDVNGLHHINNSRGHREGDIMLRFVAKEVQTQFGLQDSYRIGGDEYVVFVVDEKEDEVQERIKTLLDHVQEENYHVALGYQMQKVNELDINDLIVQAETKMYQAKADYYKRHDRRAR